MLKKLKWAWLRWINVGLISPEELRASMSASPACSIELWISVDDRLPASDSIDGEFSDQLVWGPGVARPVMCYFDGDKWHDSADDEWLTGITHWMPLPEPPAQ